MKFRSTSGRSSKDSKSIKRSVHRLHKSNSKEGDGREEFEDAARVNLLRRKVWCLEFELEIGRKEQPMRGFDYYKVTTVVQVIALLTRYQGKASILAGGSDLLTRVKDRLEGPKLQLPQHLLDITGIKELRYIRDQKNGLKIGATTILTDIASSPLVADKYPLLSRAASQVAVPQIRNVGTLGGNLCQRPRCWYFRGKLFKDCFRKGGDNCYAPSGENQYHAIFGGENCYMVCPSDLATALTALNARVEIATPKGNKLIPIEQFYIRPGRDVLKETVLGSSEMVLGVEIPAPIPGSKGIFLKLKEREAFDFAVVSAAAMVTVKNDIVSDARIVLGGIAPFPLRVPVAEGAIKGKRMSDAMDTVCKTAVDGAQPLSNNGYKVIAAKGIMEEALSSLA
jgi:xanthine dehydrogenase YagS FAD-binding subunit